MKQISMELANRPGELSRALGYLAARNIEIRALTVGHAGLASESGLVKMIVNRIEPALEALRANGIAAEQEQVVVTAVDDHAGGLHAILKILADAELNIEHLYTFVSRVEGKALSVFTFKEPERARQVLHTSGVQLVNARHTGDLDTTDLDDIEITQYWGHDVTW